MQLISDFLDVSNPIVNRANAASHMFAVANLLNGIASLTIAAMDAHKVRLSGNATYGERLGAYGGVASISFLTMASLIAWAVPQFAPVVLIASLLMPNFASIGMANDLKDKMNLLESQGQYTYARQIIQKFYDQAVADSIPILNWFTPLFPRNLPDKISRNMSANNHSLCWSAIKELHAYNQINSVDAKNRVEIFKQAINANKNAWSALLMATFSSETADYYVDDGRILTYATVLDIYGDIENQVVPSELSIIQASANGVTSVGVEPEVVNFSLLEQDKRTAVNAMIYGESKVKLIVDVRKFLTKDKDNVLNFKGNTFEIKRNNIVFYGNSKSQFALDVGLAKDLSSIFFMGDLLDSNNIVQIQDLNGNRRSLFLNLDYFVINRGLQNSSLKSLTVQGFLSYNFTGTDVVGTQKGQTYIYGGGDDRVVMTGGLSEVTLGGGASTLLMDKGMNKAFIRLTASDESGSVAQYDGGMISQDDISKSKPSENMIDFTVTTDNDLIIYEKESSGYELESWTNVYAYSTEAMDSKNLVEKSLGYLAGNGVGSKDRAKFQNFGIMHTGAKNNYIEISGNTNISHIILDGQGANVLNLNIDSIKNKTINEMLLVQSSVTGTSFIDLGKSSLPNIAIIGRGGDLQLNTQSYAGNLDLDLMANGKIGKTVINDNVNVPVTGFLKASIRHPVSVGGELTFNLSQWRSAYIDLGDSSESNVVVNQTGWMSDQTSLRVGSGVDLSSIEFGWNGNEIVAKDITSKRDYLSLNYGVSANLDNIFFDAAFSGSPEKKGVAFGLDKLIEVMALVGPTTSVSADAKPGYYYYSGSEVAKNIIGASRT